MATFDSFQVEWKNTFVSNLTTMIFFKSQNNKLPDIAWIFTKQKLRGDQKEWTLSADKL